VKFKVGQHVRISKEKLKFAKGGEQNYHRNIQDTKSRAQKSSTRVRTGGFAK
jgi:hypothetical protein